MDAALPNRFDQRRLLAGSNAQPEPMAKPLTEAEFADAVADGLPRLVSVARRLAGDEEIAAEAVQNALLKASRSWKRFRGQSQLDTWITRIVIHCVRDAIAAERKRRGRLSASDETPEPVDRRQGPSQQIMDQEFQLKIHQSVRTLPDRQREVFVLSTWQGMSAAEIAELLNINPQAVHASLHAARQKLQTMLGTYLDDQRRRQS